MFIVSALLRLHTRFAYYYYHSIEYTDILSGSACQAKAIQVHFTGFTSFGGTSKLQMTNSVGTRRHIPYCVGHRTYVELLVSS